MKKEIVLQLLAVDFKGTNFQDNCNCAISKAAKRQFNWEEASEGLYTLYNTADEKDYYHHEFYGNSEFDTDQVKAKGQPDNTVIREIILREA